MAQRPNNQNKPAKPPVELDPEDAKSLEQLLKPFNAEQRQAVVKVLTLTKSHSGPLPDPESLEKYNQIIPAGAERIMAMAEKAQDDLIAGHKTERGLAVRAQYYAMFLIVAFVSIALISVYYHWDPWIPRIIFGSLIVRILWFLVKSPNKK